MLYSEARCYEKRGRAVRSTATTCCNSRKREGADGLVQLQRRLGRARKGCKQLSEGRRETALRQGSEGGSESSQQSPPPAA
eukprot:768344-Hanusia_phi.AAC.18